MRQRFAAPHWARAVWWRLEARAARRLGVMSARWALVGCGAALYLLRLRAALVVLACALAGRGAPLWAARDLAEANAGTALLASFAWFAGVWPVGFRRLDGTVESFWEASARWAEVRFRTGGGRVR
jgi:hypothetical protein